eukprot:CAMPEP_0172158026 /NCGR_PEP_ID=MMETSP1050-20130122/4139_1 /TAXON_ID=233186 /ORGANISM="Cryptomonas curvata, Strain CCAP979/52" /LENGTH=136 /DNA_ID=CAMNT_0012827363 /DNA_START=68 /DNA_END=478 /DNA_ORIENTATION=+
MNRFAGEFRVVESRIPCGWRSFCYRPETWKVVTCHRPLARGSSRLWRLAETLRCPAPAAGKAAVTESFPRPRGPPSQPWSGHRKEHSQAEAREGATEAKTAAAMAALHQSTAAAPAGRRGAAGERLQRSVLQQTLL